MCFGKIFNRRNKTEGKIVTNYKRSEIKIPHQNKYRKEIENYESYLNDIKKKTIVSSVNKNYSIKDH